jgi:hypothetical protein
VVVSGFSIVYMTTHHSSFLVDQGDDKIISDEKRIRTLDLILIFAMSQVIEMSAIFKRRLEAVYNGHHPDLS